MSLTCGYVWIYFDVAKHAGDEFVGDAHRLLWVDSEQVLEDGEEGDFLRGGLD